MTQDDTMALGADFIDNLFYKTEETVEHSGVKGMKWGKRKKDQLSTKPSSTIDEMLNKFSETSAEAAARQKMVDDYIKTERGKGTDEKAGGKAGGKGGGAGGKKKGGGGAKKKSSGRSGRSSDNGSSSSRAEVSRPTYKFSNSYAPRRAISDILASVPKNLGPRKPNARVQAIIDKINASVDAKKALQHAILDNSEDPETLEDIIMHYGVLGMKWGVRKDAYKAKVTAETINTYNDLVKMYKSNTGKTPSKLDISGIKGLVKDKINFTKEQLEKELNIIKASRVKIFRDDDGIPKSGSMFKSNEEAHKELKSKNDIHIEIDNEDKGYLVNNIEYSVWKKDKRDTRTSYSLTKEGSKIAYKPDLDGYLKKVTMVGTLLGGPVVGVPAGMIAAKNSPDPNEKEIKHSEDPEYLEILDMYENSLEHYGVLGMKWGVRKDRPMNAIGAGGGGEIDQEALIAEMVAKGLTMDEILKQIQDTFGGAAKTIEDIQKTIQDYMDHPFESPQERQWRHNRERLEKEDEQRRKEQAEKQKQDEANRREDEANGGRIWYDPWGFPTTNQNMPNHPAPRKVAHSEEGGAMSGAIKELVAVDSMDEILAHYGVLGMKWGVRNDDRGSGRPQGAAIKKKAPKSDIKSAPTRQIGEKYRVGTTQRRVLAVHTTKDPNDPTKTLTTTYGIDEKDYQLKLKNGEIHDLDKRPNLRTAKITNPETGDTISIKVDPFSTKFNNETGMFTTTSEKDYFILENALPKIGLDVNEMNAGYVKDREEYNNSRKSTDNNSISDDELRTVINRLQMEKTYRQLMAERNPTKPKVGHTIKKILADAAKDAAKQGLTQIGAAAIKYASAQALKKAGMPEFSKAVMKTDDKKDKDKDNTTP